MKKLWLYTQENPVRILKLVNTSKEAWKLEIFSSPLGAEVKVWKSEQEAGEIEEHRQNMVLFRKTFTSLAKSRNLESIKFQATQLIPPCRGLLNPADKGWPVCSAVSSPMPRGDDNKPLCLCCAHLEATRLWNGKVSEIKYQLGGNRKTEVGLFSPHH